MKGKRGQAPASKTPRRRAKPAEALPNEADPATSPPAPAKPETLELDRVLNELDRAFAVHKQHDAEAERRIASAAADLREFLGAEGSALQLREALKKRPPAERLFAQQLAKRMEVEL